MDCQLPLQLFSWIVDLLSQMALLVGAFAILLPLSAMNPCSWPKRNRCAFFQIHNSLHLLVSYCYFIVFHTRGHMKWARHEMSNPLLRQQNFGNNKFSCMKPSSEVRCFVIVRGALNMYYGLAQSYGYSRFPARSRNMMNTSLCMVS